MTTIEADICIVGAGPAGLAAAEVAASKGASVVIADAKPSAGRKFLMAGKSGLNLTKEESDTAFLHAYGRDAKWLAPIIDSFSPKAVQDWCHRLGQEVFTGSSGRVFPKTMKASPLLRAWLKRLADKNVQFKSGWRWTGWENNHPTFQTESGTATIHAKATILAMGGASWSRLGSDGKWADILTGEGVELAAFTACNMGFNVDWSSFMQRNFGQPVKSIVLHYGEQTAKGDFVISQRGVEGTAIYALSTALRDGMTDSGVTVNVDLTPERTVEALTERLSRPRGKTSLSNHLRKSIRLGPVKQALLREFGPLPSEPFALAKKIKAVPMHLKSARDIDEAISTGGGVMPSAFNSELMLTAKPGVFCAGEMLDWEAPTGGYLLTACLATGRWAGHHAADWSSRQASSE